ncbi:hypothetical protein BH24ACT5_BH24ACT5_14520 [soil metagenome]
MSEHSGVSIGTVSNVINTPDLVASGTRERVERSISELGYRPTAAARSLKARRSFTVAYPIYESGPASVMGPFFRELVGRAARHGLAVTAVSFEPGEHDVAFSRLLDARAADGIVLSEVVEHDPRVNWLLDNDVPFAAFGRADIPRAYNWVDLDITAGMRAVTEHVVSTGRERIAYLGWDGEPTNRFRHDGFVVALDDAEVELDPDIDRRVAFSVEAAWAATREFCERKPLPDAVICSHDLLAAGAIRALSERGLRVGIDVTVTGFDDTPLATALTPIPDECSLSARRRRGTSRRPADRPDRRPTPSRTIWSFPNSPFVRVRPAGADTAGGLDNSAETGFGIETFQMRRCNRRVRGGKHMFQKMTVVVSALALVATTGGESSEPSTEPTATDVVTDDEPAAGDLAGTVVSYQGAFGDEELAIFEQVLAPFEEETGIDVQVEINRDPAVLTTRIEGGNPPDIAGLSGPNEVRRLCESGDLQKLDGLVDVDQIRADFDEGFIDLVSLDGALCGAVIKASPKSFIWYNPTAFDAAGYAVPTSWDELQTLEDQIIADGVTPWCVGFESGDASGWPGTDWIEDILLRTAPLETYDALYAGELSWTDPAVKAAFEELGGVLQDRVVNGGPVAVASTNFGAPAVAPLFDDPPGCYLHHQASFITRLFTEVDPDLTAGTDYDFFGFPEIDAEIGNPLLVGGDTVGLFADRPEVVATLEYLLSAEAQGLWAQQGGFISPNRNVDVANYPDEQTMKIAELVTSADAVRFDGSDLLPGEVNSALLACIIDFTLDPDQLDSVLENIDDAVATAG